MSWEAYSKQIRESGFVAGGVYDLTGNPWTEFCDDPKYKFNGPQNVPKILKAIKETASCGEQIYVNDMKHMILTTDDDKIGELTGKHEGKSSLIAMRCVQCVVIGIGGEQTEPRNLKEKLLKVADYLATSGY